MIDKENLRHELMALEGYACSIYGLMDAAADAHFGWTIDGWLDIKDGASTQEQAALWWMRERLSDLWLDAKQEEARETVSGIEKFGAFIDREAPELAPLLPLIRLAAAADERKLGLLWRFARSLIGEETTL